jgi:hypothetical protein
MKLVKLADLRHGDVFLTKTSKLMVVDFKTTDGKTVCRRYSDEHYAELLNTNTLVYHTDDMKAAI